MNLWKKKENLIISSFVVLFFIGLAVWSDLCCVNASFFSSSPSPYEVPFVNKDQKQLTLESFKGKPLVVYIWATWCPVCVKKMPSLNDFAADFQAKGGEVLAISQDKGGLSKIRSLFTRKGFNNLGIYLDSAGALLSAFEGRGLPTTIFIDAQGNEVGRITGGVDWNSSQVNTLIKKYFGISMS